MASNQCDATEKSFCNSLFDKPKVGGIRLDPVPKNASGGKPAHHKEQTNGTEQIKRQLERYSDIFPEYPDDNGLAVSPASTYSM